MVDIAAQASQAAAQGQQQLTDYKNKASTYHGQYDTYNQQADAANKSVNSYTDYMKNEGSAGNVYHGEQDKQLGALGYDPAQMTSARANLNQATGALSAYSDFANSAASKWGMNAGGFAAANSGALSGLNNNIASNQGVVSSLSDLYKTAQTGANQFTGNVIQGEHETLGGLQSVFENASKQRDSAASMMSFYDDLASKQGGLNAQQQQYYAQAQQAYAAASYASAQAAQIQQQISMADQASKQAAASRATTASMAPSAPTANASHSSGPGFNATNPSNSWNAFTKTLGNDPSMGNTARGIGDLAGAGVGGLGWLGKKIWNG